jgi:hypothetical protein
MSESVGLEGKFPVIPLLIRCYFSRFREIGGKFANSRPFHENSLYFSLFLINPAAAPQISRRIGSLECGSSRA